MPSERSPIVVPLTGEHFQFLVWACRNPPHLRAYLPLTPVPGGPEVSEDGVECTLSHLRELQNLLKSTIALMEHLESGGQVQMWGIDPTSN